MSEETLKEIIASLRRDLELANRNRLFDEELSRNFEEALGPHPRITNGCWIVRAAELRAERDRLLLLLKMK